MDTSEGKRMELNKMETKKYKTWEMVKMLTESPSLKFKPVSNAPYNITTFVCADNSKKISLNGSYTDPSLDINGEWTLIEQPVSFTEAVMAYSEKNTVRCENKGCTMVYKYRKGDAFGIMRDTSDSAVTASDILHGKWFIEV